MDTASAPALKIATWNVNSLRMRLAHVQRWWQQHSPDILLLQETKVEDAAFPLAVFSAAGLYVAMHGQKSYNGVAIISRHPLSDIVPGFAGVVMANQARMLSATAAGIRLTSVYVPNGESPESPKFAFKRDFIAALTTWRQQQAARYPAWVIGGDFNIAADDRDVDDPAARARACMFTPGERQWLTDFQNSSHPCRDALRLVDDRPGLFSWWDYRQLAFQKNRGMRIDYLFVSPALAPQVRTVAHHRDERKQEQPSDHVPVVLELQT